MKNSKQNSPSDRAFGVLFLLVFTLIWIYGVYSDWPRITLILLAWMAAIVLVVTLVAATLLGPLKRLWMGLGYLMGTVISPIVLAFLYFIILTPFAIILKMTGRDELALKPDAALRSYWIVRDQESPTADSFKNQF